MHTQYPQNARPAPCLIRPETAADRAAVYALNQAAFPSPAEADLVEALRSRASPTVSLVAESGNDIVGHIFFSPVAFDAVDDACDVSGADTASDFFLMGLAPMAVIPSLQNQGIGSALVEAGLAACRQINASGIVVLGHPSFYPRFGFVPSTRYHFKSEYEVPDEAFMTLLFDPELATAIRSHSNREAPAIVRYHPAFNDLT